MEPVGRDEFPLNLQRWQRATWESARERAGLVAARHHVAHSDLE